MEFVKELSNLLELMSTKYLKYILILFVFIMLILLIIREIALFKQYKKYGKYFENLMCPFALSTSIEGWNSHKIKNQMEFFASNISFLIFSFIETVLIFGFWILLLIMMACILDNFGGIFKTLFVVFCILLIGTIFYKFKGWLYNKYIKPYQKGDKK